MTYLRRLACVLVLIGALNQASAQANQTPIQELSLNSGTIDNQFEYVIRRSNSWQDFKVIKKNWMYTLKAHTLDSLKALHEQLESTKTVVETQKAEIDQLQSNLGNTQSTLDATNLEKDSMSLFGLQMSKGAYNTMLWSVIAGLFVLLLVFIFKFRNSNAVTRAAKIALEETEQEFEEHRRVALEREQKVRRQLQDEINKQKGMA
ncbi:MAG: tRNA (guanine-N1)-methyltransferase [Bacteroidia bacterium]|nr:tRNA (guanine-N1)-methyltransferase [Bacteroidia bacterium]MBT8267633.1 tRNA (guanine-N1)-methyltransferase [Bacteroidia bacterium]NNF81169.1 tRNA (guanine-N1)-methyltransferase [Flavobacteriaceae bacterium]NNK71502.1 tRNA (guanine-N1)-methyltransferase [Flavobacteriaceae bacterium]NNL81021.1 tRNA (guanine-N1)-methyltransferase [Flavobacteriaceae bacterium]